MISIFQIKKLRRKEFRYLSQGHIGNEWENSNFSLALLNSRVHVLNRN